MKELELFLEHYPAFYTLYVAPAYERLSAEQLRARPAPGLNPAAWIFWHTARAEDLGLNRLITDGVQVFDEGQWAGRLNLPWRQIGTGMSGEEVDLLRAQVALPALHEYQAAVRAKTCRIVASLQPECLAEELSAQLLNQVLFDEGHLHPAGAYVYHVYLGKSKGWLLTHLGLNHPFYHLGELLTGLSLMGIQLF